MFGFWGAGFLGCKLLGFSLVLCVDGLFWIFLFLSFMKLHF